MQVCSYKDTRDVAKDFRRGDTVHLVNPLDGSLVHVSGMVTAVHRGTGCLDVEFPWGNKRVQADEVVRMYPGGETPVPPAKDTSYSAWDIVKSRLDDRTLSRVASLARGWIEKVYEVRARVARHYAYGRGRYAALKDVLQEMPSARTHEVNAAVEHVYDYLPKVALYWNAPGRQYRPTRSELESGSFNCPRCKEPMGRAIYRKGVKLYSCANCLFMIAPEDIFDPEEIQAASYAHRKLEASLGDRDDWVIAHAPGLAAAYHGQWGMAFRDGTWKVLGTDGNVVATVASPREAYDTIMVRKEASRRVNNDAEDLVRSVMEGPEIGIANPVQTELQETAEEREQSLVSDLGDPDFSRLDFYRSASSLATRLIEASYDAEAGEAQEAQELLAEAEQFMGAGA
jgi:hypothetical protein